MSAAARADGRLPIALALLVLLLAWPGAPVAWAGTEEFSTFDVERQEEDDESLLDHVLTRYPRAWRDEWERSTQALRTSQGCLTSGQWFIHTDLKLVAPLGNRALFGLELRQSETDVASYDYLDFSFRFPTRFGTPGAMFRPLHDKSRQDFSLTWDWGADTTALQVQAAFTFEDVFNNFWEFRQSRVGDASEPYVKRPYEPALRIVRRAPAWRAEAGGRWLTPSIKRQAPLAPGGPERHVSLWGALGWAALEAEALGIAWEARGSNWQARGADAPVDGSAGDDASHRRSWTAEIAARRALTARLGLEARWLYRERDQAWGAPWGPARLDVIERMTQLEATVEVTPRVTARLGGMYDRVGVAREGPVRIESHGTRHESRLYVGLAARFGRVWIMGVEGIELDPEPYDVWLVHDKGFLHLQTRF